MPLFSILIPTFNRREKLRVVLEALQKQPRITEGEVIVGIDGSTDGTEEGIKKMIESLGILESLGKMRLSYFRIDNSGRAVIRNQLIECATGDILIFIQDDIVVSEGWLEAHLKNHKSDANTRMHANDANENCRISAVVGHITWYSQAPITPYMRWLEHGGHMLNFSGLRDGDETDFWHFYMGNISIPRALVEGESEAQKNSFSRVNGDKLTQPPLRFDELLKTYGWEDIVFGYEFAKRGHKIIYSKKALAWHWDEYREEDLPEYMKRLALSAKAVVAKYPDLGVIPPWWKRGIFRIMIMVGSIFWPILPQSWKWYLSMKREFLKGL